MVSFEKLNEIEGVQVELDCDLTKYSTMRLKSTGTMITVSSVEALIACQKFFKENTIYPRIVGMGANQILPPSSDRPYLVLKFPFNKDLLNEVREEYVLPASVRLSSLTSHAAKYGLKGWEGFTGVPASIGGAIVMNAGTNLGEIGDVVKSVKYVDRNGEIHDHLVSESSFVYRNNNFLSNGDIVISVTLKNIGIDESLKKQIKDYLELRNKSQPMWEKTCGCVFKNSKTEVTCRAGQFIDILGLKGLTHNGLRVSTLHANFMENFDSATYDDAIELIKMVQDELELQYGVKFETEVKIN